MKRLVILMLVVLLAVCLVQVDLVAQTPRVKQKPRTGTIAVAESSDKKVEKNDKNAESQAALRALIQKRVIALRGVEWFAQMAVQNERSDATIKQYQLARARRCEAELDLQENMGRRVDLQQDRVEHLQQAMVSVEHLHKANAIGGEKEEYERVKAMLQEAQAALEHDRAALRAEQDSAMKELQAEAQRLEEEIARKRKEAAAAPREAKITPERETTAGRGRPAPSGYRSPRRSPFSPNVAPADPPVRYGGKTFGQWQYEWKSELKPQRRTEAILAMTAFAATERRPEQIREIVRMMRQYDMSSLDPINDVGKLKQAAIEALGPAGLGGHRIPAALVMPILCEELDEGPRDGRLFAARVLARLGHEAREALPRVERMAREEQDGVLHNLAFVALAQIDLSGQRTAAVLRDWLKRPETEPIESVKDYLSHLLSGLCMNATRVGPFGNPQPARIPWVESIVEVFAEAVRDEREPVRLAAIEVLGSAAPASKLAQTALIRASVHKDPRTAVCAIRGLGNRIPKEAVPALIEAAGRPDKKVRKAAFYALIGGADGIMSGRQEVLHVLLEALPRVADPKLRASIVRLLPNYGPSSGPEVISVLQKMAGTDKDEGVRKAAKEILMQMGSPMPY